MTTLLFYQVGFEQYQIVLLLLASYLWWTIPDRPGRARDPVLLAALAGYFGWLAVFDVFSGSIGGIVRPGEPWQWVAYIAGLPTFLLGCALLGALLRSTVRQATAA